MAQSIDKIHPSDLITSRERIMAAYQGQPVDRIPYWPKVTNANWRTGQNQHIAAMSEMELLDYIGADGLFGAKFATRIVRPKVTVEEMPVPNGRITVTHTPDGDLTERWIFDPQTKSWHPTEFPIKTLEDVGRFRWRYENVSIENDEQSLAAMRQKVKMIGQRGVCEHWWGTSPLMDLVEHSLGPVDTTYMLMDYPREMEELMELMHAECLMRAAHVARHTPGDIVVSGENTSTTLISPQQFEKYCYRHLCEYGRAIEAAGKIHQLHMCGHILPLLQTIDTIPAASIEAFTSPPLGSARLADGRAKAPSKALIGGTNVMNWLLPVEKIKAYIHGELEACPNHRRIVLTTAGVAPQACSAQTFRQIGQWLAAYPAKM